MRDFTIGLAVGWSVLTLLGVLLFHTPQPVDHVTQLNIFRELLSAYTPLLTPLSSAMGASSLGGGAAYGVLPLLSWLTASGIVGVSLRNPAKSAKATFATALIILLLWITSAFIAAPTWGDSKTWLNTVDAMASDLLLNRPIDLLSALILPPAVSALTASILEKRSMRAEITEEDYLFY